MQQSVLAAAVMAAIAAMSGSAQAAANNPLIVWQGSATITALTGASCANTGFEVGDLLHSVYRPNLDPAEPATGLTLAYTRGALSFFRTSGNTFMNGAGNYSGTYISGRATARPNSTQGFATGAYHFTVIPATFTAATTVNVDITGTLTNFFGFTGCTVGIKASYQRRP